VIYLEVLFWRHVILFGIGYKARRDFDLALEVVCGIGFLGRSHLLSLIIVIIIGSFFEASYFFIQ
jgi:hypothetical protein